MKTLTSIFFMFCFQGLVFSQVNLNRSGVSTTECSMVYSQAHSGMVFDDSTGTCRTIVIKDLPDIEAGIVPVKIRFNKGSYTLSKDPGLIVPDHLVIVIEDLLTGQTFNLANDAAYSFNVNRSTTDRMVVYIKKQPEKITASR